MNPRILAVEVKDEHSEEESKEEKTSNVFNAVQELFRLKQIYETEKLREKISQKGIVIIS